MGVSDNTLVEAGVSAGLLDADEVSPLRHKSRLRLIPLPELLCREKRFPLASLYHALAQVRGLPFREAADLGVDREVLRLLPAGLAARCRALPVREHGSDRQLLVTDQPDDSAAIDAVRRGAPAGIEVAVTDPSSLDALLAQAAGHGPRGADSERDAVEVLDRIMQTAYLRRASDVHFEPLADHLRVRMRIDGQMRETGPAVAGPLAASLISRVKVLAQMDIGEQRTMQDGSFEYALAGWDVPPLELRAASMPVVHGERLALRLLGDRSRSLSLTDLGMPGNVLQRVRHALGNPHGMLLVTGPTGSGKSTTLYAALRELDAGRLNILTVEDPIEQRIEGISQTQLSAKVSFESAVRGFLRHDPDVILVGEVRDRDTAEAAIRAAMTGHMVLTTLHTNHACGAIARLADIGCERFLIAATVLGVIAQRLVRRLCPACRRQRPARADEQALLGGAPAQVWDAPGCAACGGTGYAGRIGLFELLWVDLATAERIQTGASERQLIEGARDYYTLADDARVKVLDGLTSVAEVGAFLAGSRA